MKRVLIGVAAGVLTTACGDAGTGGEARGPREADTPDTFVGTLGVDTVFVERLSRTGSTIEGDVVDRQPRTHRIVFRAEIDSAGHVVSMTGRRYTPAPATADADTVTFGFVVDGTAAVVTVDGGDFAGEHRFAIRPGVIPSLGRTPIGIYEWDQAARQMVAAGSEQHPVQFLSILRARLNDDRTYARLDEETLSVEFFGYPYRGTIDADGRLVATSGALTTMKIDAAPAETPPDLDALATRWAEADERGEGLGVPSPAATEVARVGGATIEVDYSQPAMRGREIWGALVPYGTVWRTGANAATHLRTDRALVFETGTLPPGQYTLWSDYSASDQTLIINAQTGQWGTQYDEARDVLRVPMVRAVAPGPAERFRIDIEEAAAGGLLRLTWGDRTFSVPFRTQN